MNGYDASETSIKEIFKDNFKNLRKLCTLKLSANTIEIIFNDTFEDLVELQNLFLGELSGQKLAIIVFVLISQIKTKSNF